MKYHRIDEDSLAHAHCSFSNIQPSQSRGKLSQAIETNFYISRSHSEEVTEKCHWFL